MSNQPEALRLADALESGTYLLSRERDATAAELRRQHAEIERLKVEREALRAELREATESVDDPAVNNLRTLSEAIHMLRTERDALRADSERYRWLFCHDDKTARVNSVWRLWDGQSDWGAAIDAAREKK